VIKYSLKKKYIFFVMMKILVLFAMHHKRQKISCHSRARSGDLPFAFGIKLDNG